MKLESLDARSLFTDESTHVRMTIVVDLDEESELTEESFAVRVTARVRDAESELVETSFVVLAEIIDERTQVSTLELESEVDRVHVCDMTATSVFTLPSDAVRTTT